MNIHFIKTPEKRRIIEVLNKQFGIEELPYLLFESGKEKIRAFSGSLSKDEIAKLSEIAHIETIGLYLIRKENEYRLGLDATNLLKEQIKKNIVELTEDEFQKWIRGRDIEKKAKRGIYIIKYKEDFIGCGKSNEEIIFNYVPKDRRLKIPIKN